MKPSTKVFAPFARCRVQAGVGKTRVNRVGLVCAALVLAACGRSQLELLPAPVLPVLDASVAVDHPLEVAPDVAPDRVPEVRPDVPPDRPIDRPIDLAIDRPVDLRRETAPEVMVPPPVDTGPVCHPHDETCNGLDDDCNGKVDDGLPSIPCPNGGQRYCVAGAYSECPRRCDVCVPGSERECFTSFCTYWGTQSCASDGRSFGPCKESAVVPSACQAITDQAKHSPALEKCCIEQGLCCLDEFDLDKDGDTAEMLGRCDSVTCGP
jgi:hypothetical protein